MGVEGGETEQLGPSHHGRGPSDDGEGTPNGPHLVETGPVDVWPQLVGPGLGGLALGYVVGGFSVGSSPLNPALVVGAVLAARGLNLLRSGTDSPWFTKVTTVLMAMVALHLVLAAALAIDPLWGPAPTGEAGTGSDPWRAVHAAAAALPQVGGIVFVPAFAALMAGVGSGSLGRRWRWVAKTWVGLELLLALTFLLVAAAAWPPLERASGEAGLSFGEWTFEVGGVGRVALGVLGAAWIPVSIVLVDTILRTRSWMKRWADLEATPP